MKMGNLEKQFINSPSHSRQVSQHAERLLTLIDVKAGQTYLDVGCGNGAAAIYLAQKYHLDVTGIDVDPDQIRLAQAQSQGLANVRFLAIDGTRLPFETGEFDVVFTNKVTHHIPDWEAALIEMLRALKPGGYLIYADLIYPGWLAAMGKTLAGSRAGFPMGRALTALFEQHRLAKIHRLTSPMHYETVLQKPTD